MSGGVSRDATVTVRVQSTLDWPENVECDDTTHYFDEVPGRCRCKRETWDVEPPKLRLVE